MPFSEAKASILAGQTDGTGSGDDLEDLFENAPCGYVSARPDGRITKVNLTLASWLGRDREQLVGRRFQDMLNIAGKIYYETHFAPLLRMQGFFNEVALDFVGEGGRVLPVLVNAVERRDAEGRVRFLRITVFNASDRRRYERELLEARRAAELAGAELRELNLTLEARVAEAVERRMEAEEALRQAQKMEAVGQLTGGIAHDFNNLLQAVHGSLDLIRRKPNDPERVARWAGNGLQAAERGAKLTAQLLAFSRAQKLELRPVAVVPLITGMEDMLQRTLGPMVHITVAPGPDEVAAMADPTQLEMAVLNLAINARDAMPDGGELRIATLPSRIERDAELPPGDYLQVRVGDTGAGMPTEVAARAFDPFFTTKGVGKGTGLGLSQVYGFAKQAGGTARLDSMPGRGTVVTLFLRRADQQPDDAAAEPHAMDQPSVVQAAEVLVVDDDQDVRQILAETLRDLGYRVREAEGGEAALALLEQAPPDVLVVDFAMPGMNGAELARAVRALHPRLPVVFASGYAETAAIDAAIEGPPLLLRKPFRMEELEAILATALERASGPGGG